MKEDECKNNYFFVDESGDTVFYNKKGDWIVGKENGASKILLMGFIKTLQPEYLRKRMNELKIEISNDEYLKDIPSIKKTKIAFHAKDDCPEVRYKVYKLLKELPFSCKIVIIEKKQEVFQKFNGNTQKIYDSLMSNLFNGKIELSNNNHIYISIRGNKKRQKPLEQAILGNLEDSENSSAQKIFPQTPSEEACLQIIDYCNWAVQRAFLQNEMRYYNFLKDKFEIIEVLDNDQKDKPFMARY